MIIKSLSRKSASFAQLYDYISEKEWSDFTVWHNIGGYCPDRWSVLRTFYGNSRYLSSRKGGNALYHEIISIPRSSVLSVEQHAEVLHDLTVRYLQRRAPNQIAVAKLHAEETHVHVHVMLSSNEFSKATRVRLSKTEFLGIQREMERYVLSHYPSLDNRPVYAPGSRWLAPLDRGETKPATDGSVGTRSWREDLRSTLALLLDQNHSVPDLGRALKEHGILLAYRGKNITAERRGLKVRLKTIGLDSAHEDCLEVVKHNRMVENRNKELQAMREQLQRVEPEFETEAFPDLGLLPRQDHWG